MAGKKDVARQDPLAPAKAERASLRAMVANAISDALPTPGADRDVWGNKINTFLTDLVTLVVSKVSSINGVTPNPSTGDVDLSGTFTTPLTVATTATADGTLVKGKHNPVDATSGTRTMTLPTAGVTAGSVLSVEKVDTGPNPVVISGTIRGAASTLTIYDPNDVRNFVAESTSSWRPLADHRPSAARRGRRVNAFYDEFSRFANGALSGSVAIVGGAWQTSGAAPTAVTSGKASSSGTGYASPSALLSSKIAAMGCEVQWSGSGNSSVMTLIASSDSTITIANAVHFNFGPTGFLLTLRQNSVAFDPLLSGVWDSTMLVDGATTYRIAMVIRGNTVIVFGPGGETFRATDPRVGLLNGTLPIWEPNTGAGTTASLLSVFATTEVTSGQMSPGDLLALHGGGGSAQGAARQISGNRNFQHETMIGLDPTTNYPAITFGATTIYTVLDSAVSIGAATVSTRDAIPNGSTVQLESGTNSESLTTNGNPSGSYPGPYSQAVSSTATKAHAAGTAVAATVPVGKRTVAYFNVQTATFYLPSVNTVVQGSNLYFGTALDVQLARLAAGVVGVGSTQMIRTGTGATGSRPAASLAASAQWFDSTLGQPIWSTGSQWADGNGYINPLLTRTSSTTIGLGDKITVWNGASLTATLPDPTTIPAGRILTVKNINASALTVVSAGTSKTIDGAASASLAQWAAARYVSDATQWLSV